MQKKKVGYYYYYYGFTDTLAKITYFIKQRLV